MNLHIIAADLAKRIPEMAQDSAENNEQFILGLLQSYHADLFKRHLEICVEENISRRAGQISKKLVRSNIIHTLDFDVTKRVIHNIASQS